MTATARLLTGDILERIPSLGGSASDPDPTIWARLDDPSRGWTWWIREYDLATGVAYGLLDGYECDWGAFRTDDIERVGDGGVLRDASFEPTPFSRLRAALLRANPRVPPAGSGTPFQSRTAPLCAGRGLIDWAGRRVAGSYEELADVSIPSRSSFREHHAIRHTAALIDVSPLFKYRIDGPDAARALDRIVTRDITQCGRGQALYTSVCDEGGKLVDEGPVYGLDDGSFLIVTTRSLWRWLHDHVRGDVSIEDQSDDTAVVALQGPLSRAILADVSDVGPLKYWRHTRARVGGVDSRISRTGYTGDLGYEIWVLASDAERVWDVLMTAGRPRGLVPAGVHAMLLARVESGLVMMESDYVSASRAVLPAQTRSPLELGLHRTVDLDKDDFIGREALLAERRGGPTRRLVGLEVDWDAYVRLLAAAGLPPVVPTAPWGECTRLSITSRGEAVGSATSGGWSPTLCKYIALGTVAPAHARPGSRLEMELPAGHAVPQVPVTVVPTPFYDPPHRRA